MADDFQTIAHKFSALSSVVRVPSLDPKYKIALLLSKQVISFLLFCVLLFSCPEVVRFFCL